MKNQLKVYKLKDPAQYEDKKKFWSETSIEYKLNALEEIRESYFKLFNINKDEVSKRLRNVYRVVKRKRS